REPVTMRQVCSLPLACVPYKAVQKDRLYRKDQDHVHKGEQDRDILLLLAPCQPIDPQCVPPPARKSCAAGCTDEGSEVCAHARQTAQSAERSAPTHSQCGSYGTSRARL